MITTIKELLNEEFNLRHFICHTSTDYLNDSNATKEELIDSVMSGIEMWKMHMIQLIIERSGTEKDAEENKKMPISRSNRHMRKRVLTKQVAVLLFEKTYQQLIKVTEEMEISISQFIRESIEANANLNKGEEYNECKR